MRRSFPALALLLFVTLPAGGQEPPRDEEAALLRTAMEARLKAGDLLKEKGDLEGALRAYEEAMALYREYKGAQAPAPAPAPLPAAPQAPAGDAIGLGLAWLAAHQDVDGDGKWDCDGFEGHDPAGDPSGGAGGAHYDVGVTGLALLAFLGAGHTGGEAEANPYARNVRQGLRFLMTWQDTEGCFGRRASQHFIYNHAIATLAMCRAYGATRNPRYRESAQNGLRFIAAARNPYIAWRYEPRGGENDTSVTGWCVMALDAGRQAGLEVDLLAFEGARLWIDKMTDAEFGQVGYNMPGGTSARPEGSQDRFPPEKTAAMTASGILTRVLAGEDPAKSAAIRKGADLCIARPPRWDPEDGSIDMYYWLHGTWALRHVGGAPWKRWTESMQQAALGSQQRDGSRKGSWDPAGVWGGDGGRVYSTAVMVLCLEGLSLRPGPRPPQ